MVDLIDVVLEGIKGVVDWFIGLFMDGLRSGYETLTEGMFGTPTPETNGAFVFGEPTNAPWPAIHDALIGGEIMLVALLLLVMSVQGRLRFESSISEVPTKPENQEDSLGRSLSDYYMVLDWDSRTLPRRRIHYRPDAGAFLRSLGDASVLRSSHHKPRTGAVVRRDWWNLDVGSRGRCSTSG